MATHTENKCTNVKRDLTIIFYTAEDLIKIHEWAGFSIDSFTFLAIYSHAYISQECRISIPYSLVSIIV